MTFENFQKATAKELKNEAQMCFDRANESRAYPAQTNLLLAAQFYMQELDRRHDSFVSLRDLVLEIVVILLIGGEIGLAIKQGKDEDKLMDKQNRILVSLQSGMQATADLLKEQLANEYRVFINPQVTPSGAVALYNNSKSAISLWGFRVGDLQAVESPRGATEVAEHNVATINLMAYYSNFEEMRFPAPSYSLYIKNGKGEEFVWTDQLETRAPNSPLTGSLRAEEWSKSISLSKAPVAGRRSSSGSQNQR